MRNDLIMRTSARTGRTGLMQAGLRLALLAAIASVTLADAWVSLA